MNQMLLIEFLYTLGGLISLGACVPQLRQLIATKQSDEFSLHSWGMWTATQMTTLIYVTSIGNVLMMCINVAWVSFYGFMTYLIIRYRRPAQPEFVEQSPEA